MLGFLDRKLGILDHKLYFFDRKLGIFDRKLVFSDQVGNIRPSWVSSTRSCKSPTELYFFDQKLGIPDCELVLSDRHLCFSDRYVGNVRPRVVITRP